MDGTLTKPNLDFGEMYRRCGVDESHDILERVEQMPLQQRERTLAIIDEVEEQGRQTLELMPGAVELIHWLQSHGIPMAIVTRNTHKTTTVLTQKISVPFSPIIARDAGYPPKPNPAALTAIAQAWEISLPSDCLLMVGDSLSHDVVFGQNAGVRTALLSSQTHSIDNDHPHAHTPDFVTPTLCRLAQQLWHKYRINSPLGEPTLSKAPKPEPTTPLAMAAVTGDVSAMKHLLTNAATSINEIDEHGNTALIWAIEGNHEFAVQYLLGYDGIHINHQGYLGATAVSRAARRGYPSILQMLIKAKANLDIPNDKLQYPLHFAAFQQHLSIVELLLHGGANPLVLDRKGRTPAHDTSNKNIQELLFKAEKRKLQGL